MASLEISLTSKALNGFEPPLGNANSLLLSTDLDESDIVYSDNDLCGDEIPIGVVKQNSDGCKNKNDYTVGRENFVPFNCDETTKFLRRKKYGTAYN